jgi:hypothetical protein
VGPRPDRRGGTLNFAKLDAALAAAVDAPDDAQARDLIVFVDLESDAPAPPTAAYERFGLGGGGAHGGVRTATLSAHDVDALSEQPWVGRLRLARRLGLSS